MGTAAKNRAVTSSRSPATSTVIPALAPSRTRSWTRSSAQASGPDRKADTQDPQPHSARTRAGAPAVWRRAQPPGHFFRQPLQNPHGPAEFVQPHDCPDPGGRGRFAEGTGGIQKIEMRFVLAAEELIDDECQDGVGTAVVARDQSQMTVCGREPAELGDPLLFGKVQQPQPDPVAAPVRGKRHIPGEGLCDGTAWWAAAGCLPQGGYGFRQLGHGQGRLRGGAARRAGG